MTLPTITNKIPTSYSTATVVRKIKDGTLRLVGVNVAVTANVMTEAQVLEILATGSNWIRAHHLAVAINEGWISVPAAASTWDIIKAKGGRVSIDLVENLGELTPWGLTGFKEKLCQFDPAAETILEGHIQNIDPLLRHPALFMVGIINECAGFLTPDVMRKLRARWEPLIRERNPKVMVYTTNDIWTSGNQELIHVVAEEDCMAVNFYPVEDFLTKSTCSWINETWHLDGVKWWAGWLRDNGTPKPIMVTEFGSSVTNPKSIENEVVMHMVAADEGWSVCAYLWSSGGAGDKYAINETPLRRLNLVFGGILNKNRVDLAVTRGGDALSATGKTVDMPNRGIVRVGSATSGYVFRTDSDVEVCPDWARLTKVV